MPRVKASPKEQVNVRLPTDLIDRIREQLKDPVRNKTKHGSVADLITTLLYDWSYRSDKTIEDI